MENKGFIFINLLPYREKIKSNQIKKFISLISAGSLIAILIITVTHLTLSIQLENQTSRNDFISKENLKLDDSIKSIVTLKEEIKNTIMKRNVVEALQVNRADGVNIINEIANNLPDDVFLKNFTKIKNKLTIIGQTTSNNKVSQYMTALDKSPVFNNPDLIEIKSVILKPDVSNKNKVNQQESISEFSITVEMQNSEEKTKNSEEINNKKNKVDSNKK